ncbi:MAG: SGNH/GDSL hydrolase family protein [Kiritimatiellia bacterium]
MRVVLLGDSIRHGYMRGVRERLGSSADVVWTNDNSGNSMLIREHLREWVLDFEPDIVHFNAGVHDLGWMAEETVPRFTISAYVRNLRIIVDRLRKASDARLIFAATTPFLIPVTKGIPKAKCRPARIVERYNCAAAKLMQSRQVAIDDLYKAVMDAGLHECLGDDKLHMSEYGNEVLAEAVAECIRRNLA